jgi:hypothetical protein
MYPDLFEPSTTQALTERIHQLSPQSKALWGKMNVQEMLAHCSLTYEYNNGQKEAKIPGLVRLILKGMMRKAIAGPQPYKQNSPTASYFKVVNPDSFEAEKTRLIDLITTYQKAGKAAAEQRPHAWLGHISGDEWSAILFKHLDHHLRQFGV